MVDETKQNEKEETERFQYITTEKFEKFEKIVSGKELEKDYDIFYKTHKTILNNLHKNRNKINKLKEKMKEYIESSLNGTQLETLFQFFEETLQQYLQLEYEEVDNWQTIFEKTLDHMKILYMADDQKEKEEPTTIDNSIPNWKKVALLCYRNSQGILQKQIEKKLDMPQSSVVKAIQTLIKKDLIKESEKKELDENTKGMLKKYLPTEKLLTLPNKKEHIINIDTENNE